MNQSEGYHIFSLDCDLEFNQIISILKKIVDMPVEDSDLANIMIPGQH